MTLSYFKSYRGVDCMQWFVQEISQLSELIYSKLNHIVPLTETVTLTAAVPTIRCHICEKPFTDSDTIVRDHDHFTGNFRTFAHQACNLNYQKQFVVPVIFHNLSGDEMAIVLKFIASIK